jgi:polysaccharide pyruvyl transferase WcaK-like protein
MKILLVDDNRDNQNWGCRATSISLHQILSQKHEIINTINKKRVDAKITVYARQNKIERYVNKFRTITNKQPICRTIVEDITTNNPLESLNNLLKFKKEYDQAGQILRTIYGKVKNCDIVIINGEGSMIFTNPPRRDLKFQLMMIELANYLGKPAFYVNAMVSDCPVTGRNHQTVKISIDTLNKCQGISFRDTYSYEMIKDQISISNCRMIPDALFHWFNQYQFSVKNYLPDNGDFIIPFPEQEQYLGKLDFSKPYICMGGSSLSARYPEKAIPAYSYLAEAIKKLGFSVYFVINSPEDKFLYQVSNTTKIPVIPVNTPILMGGSALANASLFISGRYHPSILASLGGTPCIFLGSNSHKTKSLQEVLNYPTIQEFSAFPTEDEVQEIVLLAKDKMAQGESLRNSIIQTVKKRSEESRKILELINI